MESKKNYIDLHIHTNKSDGQFNPTEIINIAYETQTSFISICDHDAIEGIYELKSNLLKNMNGINGVEFSTYININNKRRKLHILGYGFDSNSFYILKLLEEMKQKRIYAHITVLDYIKYKIKKVPEEEFSKLDMGRYCWFDREVIKCLEDGKVDKETILTLKTYFKENRFSYGNDYELNAIDVINAIKMSGGYAILAHPMAYRLTKNEITEIMLKLIEMGIDGIEIFQSDCSVEDSMYLKSFIDKYNLLYSVGSDFHRIINSDGRMIGCGINNNLCIEETSLTNKILEKKKYFKGKK